MDASRLPLMTSQLVAQYQRPFEHPVRKRGRRKREGQSAYVFIHCTSVNAFVCVYILCLHVAYLKSSEDTVCMYVVLGTDKHGWRRGYGVTVVAGCMATAEQEQNYK